MNDSSSIDSELKDVNDIAIPSETDSPAGTDCDPTIQAEPDVGPVAELSQTSRKPFWGIAQKISTASASVANKAASIGTSGVIKAAEVGKQSYVAAGSVVEATGAVEESIASAESQMAALQQISMAPCGGIT